MIEIMSYEIGFMVLLLSFFLAAGVSLLLAGNDKYANIGSNCFSIIGSVWGIIFSVTLILSNRELSFNVGETSWPLLNICFNIDKLSAFFIFIIALVSLLCSIYSVGYIKQYYNKYSIGSLCFFYNIFIIGMMAVVTVGNALFFLFFWEIMSNASYFLVVYDRNDVNNVKAGFIYLVMTNIGTMFIAVAFLLIFKFSHSFDFSAMRDGINLLPLSVKNTVFILMLIGFGTKAGIIPLHIWLPSAHPAAPSHVSALMSGVMIKIGVYMMIRMFLDILQPTPIWWGLTILIIGAVSSLLGVLYALTEQDIKRLLAFSSIENIGIILLGVGSALAFYSLGMCAFAALSLTAALFHILNHATFKALLFLGAGSIIHQTHTRNMEKYGGLIKIMPQTTFCFLIGSMAISALPPFNGFFSEWLTFQVLFKGILLVDFWSKWVFILATGSLAFTGGLALACFVKAFAITFLARPRSESVNNAKESSLSLRIGMFSLAILSVVFGIFSGYATSVLENISGGIFNARNFPLTIYRDHALTINSSYGNDFVVGSHLGSVSGLAILLSFAIVLVMVVILLRFVIYKKQNIKIGDTWNCGTALTARMEINTTGFSRSIVLIFKGLLKPSMQYDIEYSDAKSRYLPNRRIITVEIKDIYDFYFYQPLYNITSVLSVYSKSIQGGNINMYILYILLALLLSLLLVV